ncbi:MAG TPA: methyltransferase domain-containing protein [Acidimicrobiales bacterium]|nr:methyltransferase domain-containing protein [Acidimicrobiales bacterium]
MVTRWDPEQYLKYGDERGRPWVELIGRVFHPSPKQVIDLGCGPGTTTAMLLDRWPDAHIVGMDSSEEMIERARSVEVPGRLDFRVGDLSDLGWTEGGPFDVVLCAATFQWVPDHAALFPDIVDTLSETGVFAFQVPANFDQPSHTLLYELAGSDRWSPILASRVRPDPVLSPSGYLESLLATGTTVDVWSTTYLHVLRGADAVLEWVRGTALRPFLSALEENGPVGAAAEFEASYGSALRAAYPMDEEGRTIFPFRRIFSVASRGVGGRGD